MTLDELIAASGGTKKATSSTSSQSSSLDRLIAASKPAPRKTLTPLPYELPVPGVGGRSNSTPSSITENSGRYVTDRDATKFLAGVAGAGLRSGLSIGLDVQNVATGNMPAPINTREELGDYAAYFLGDEPINALSSDYLAAIQGSGQDNATNSFVNLFGTTAGAALNLFPVYGSLARKAAELGTRKFILKSVTDLSGGEAVNTRKVYNLPVKGNSILSPINVNTPYVPANQLPVIDYGKPTKSGLPEIQIGAPKQTAGGYTYVPIGNGLEVPVRTETPSLKPIVRPRAGVESGPIAKGALDAQAIGRESGVEIPAERLARTARMTFDSQEARINQLISDVQEIRRIAADPSRLPNDIQAPAAFNAMIAYAKKNKDWSLLSDLSASRLATASTEAGRSLVSTKIGQDPVVKAIQEIGKARQEGLKTFKGSPGKIKTAAKTEITKEIAKQPSDWNSFIDEITC